MDEGGSTTVLAVLDGGPGDGQEHVVAVETVVLRVTAGDSSRHLYERVHMERIMTDGRRAVIFRWRGHY